MMTSEKRCRLSSLLLSLFFLLCCLSSGVFVEAIIGGDKARDSGYPYFALLEIKSEIEGGVEVLHYCGATLIHPDIILTSAFCDRGRIVATAQVNETSFQEGYRNPLPFRRDRIIERAVKHPQFTDATIHHDLMLMKLNEPIDDGIQPVKIDKCVNRPVRVSEDDNTIVTAVGLGLMSNIGQVDPEELQSAQFPTVSHETCDKQLGADISLTNHICAGRSGAGACPGDAGGPLVVVTDGQPETDYLVGIISMSDEGQCGEANKPGLYTRVYPYLDWIYEKICEISSVPPECCVTNTCTVCESAAPAPAPTGFVVCFSGETEVTTEQHGTIPMSDLRIGDKVLSSFTSAAKPIYDMVYSFGHSQPDVFAEYLKISFEDKKSTPLEISPDHLVFEPTTSANPKPIPASQLKIGDEITSLTGAAVVNKIESVTRRGAYAPFTYSGKFLVNSGLLVSSFITLQPELHFLFENSIINHHTIAHLFETPHRLIKKLFFFNNEEVYNPDTGLLQFW
eukprot:CAMPEP_0194174756 /NCGR_PEP_ID=MMETSP0154-20130528/8901_1 /TAXON_ID=1049557 /ORGANISM="Thalassiothrix antarctica, Strain L6-D1" /LENGTH=508 /DNA_ID=CAMNT_0038888317 /DNA_START=95 /DNA_END=1618 /DNA_ORIENTATION=-